jgi:hypothetical protein
MKSKYLALWPPMRKLPQTSWKWRTLQKQLQIFRLRSAAATCAQDDTLLRVGSQSLPTRNVARSSSLDGYKARTLQTGSRRPYAVYPVLCQMFVDWAAAKKSSGWRHRSRTAAANGLYPAENSQNAAGWALLRGRLKGAGLPLCHGSRPAGSSGPPAFPRSPARPRL